MLGLDNPIHIAFLLILLLLVFGAKRLPEMGKSLGAGMRGFKDSLTGESAPPAPVVQPTEPATPAPVAAVVGAPAPLPSAPTAAADEQQTQPAA